MSVALHMNSTVAGQSSRVTAATALAVLWLAGLAMAQEPQDTCVIELPELLHSNPEWRSQPLFHADSVDVPPERLSSPPLAYPRDAVEDGWTGWVHVAAVIDTSGHVELERVIGSSVELLSRQDLKSTVRPRREDVLRSEAVASSRSDIRRQFERVATELILKSEFRPALKHGKPVRAVVCLPITFTIILPP